MLFPRLCFGCGGSGTWLCESCLTRIPEPLIPVSVGGAAEPLSGVIAGAPFRVPIVRKLVHGYKYRFQKDLAGSLAALMARSVGRTVFPLPDILTFVPLHPRRERYRGFNQAELLAENLAPLLMPGLGPVHVAPLLARVRPTPPQMKTRSRAERLENLRGAFSARVPRAELRGRVVWIVDDVSTTGATLAECAAVLRRAGASRVYGVVAAK